MSVNKQQARSLLAAIASEARSGESLRLVCPFCAGGRTGEASLVLTFRHDGTFYCCHRAQCGEAGTVNRIYPVDRRPDSRTPKYLEIPYTELRPESVLAERWSRATNLDIAEAARFGLFCSEDDPDIAVWECRDLDGTVLGHQTRTLGSPKRVLSYKGLTTGPLYHYAGSATGKLRLLVVVEDALSACSAAARGAHGLALLGTHLHDDLAYAIGKAHRLGGFDNALILLDPGAEKDAIRAYRRLQVFVPSVAVYYPAQDLKDTACAAQQAMLESFSHPMVRGSSDAD